MSIAVIGAGAMGEALLAGWIAAGTAPADIMVVDPGAQRVEDLVQRHGVRGVDVKEAAGADTVVVAVKPHHVAEVLDELRGRLGEHSLVISIAAGVTLDALQRALPGVAVVRVMPNTPALLREGMAGVVPGAQVTPEQAERALALLEAVGKAILVDEGQLDALTSLSGSGPAYLFYVAEAMIEAGVHQGLSRAQSAELVNQTFVGAGAMLTGAGRSATQLREMVTSPAGTTAAALRVLDERGVRAGFLAAVEACRRRSAELSGH